MKSLILIFSALFAVAIGKTWGQTSHGYRMIGEPIQISNGLRVNLSRANSETEWDGEAETLTLDAEFQSNYRLRVKVYNVTQRYEVPLEIFPPTGGSQNPLYEVQFQNDPIFKFKVIRKATGTILFESSPDEFVFADQYLSMTWKPASENVYGIGENEQASLKHDFSKNLSYALWAKDQVPDKTSNMYGVQPHYTVVEDDGNAHAVVIMNSNAQQFSMVTGPTIKYITIGGILDFYFFLGPTPENTVEQYTEAAGRPPIPPYWGLGFQLCRFGYDSIERMKETVDRQAQYGIPQDVQYGDIDIMDRYLDFTYSRDRYNGLPEYVKELKTKGIKFVTILDPGISIEQPEDEYLPYPLGNNLDVWVKKADRSPVVARVWPGKVHFPDYSKNSTKAWWIQLVKEFHNLLEYDGLWIDMNEPSNFEEGDMNEGCANNLLNHPPFLPRLNSERITSQTLCMDHVQEAGLHYNVHSLYGHFMQEPTLLGAREGTGRRSMVLSRSTFLGSGRWAAHWLGDNFAWWSNLDKSVIGMLQFNLFGIPLVGADICGFIDHPSPELCQRWHEVGAFYPFSRNHNMAPEAQDPGSYGPEVAQSTRNALLVRYTLLPYLYTLFYKAATVGGTVVRSLWHEFPADRNARNVDGQFMWGSGLLISPVLEEGSVTKEAYFPNARFYNYFDGKEEEAKGQTISIPTPMDKINVHVRGGNVIPTQEPAVNTELSRKNPMGLIVALDENGEAKGQFFFDDGDTIDTVQKDLYYLADLQVLAKNLTSTVLKNGYEEMSDKRIDTVRLLGEASVTSVNVNGAAHSNFTTLPSGEVLIVGLNLNPTLPYYIVWS